MKKAKKTPDNSLQLRRLDEIIAMTRKMVESAILYGQPSHGGMSEKGVISNPERLGRLRPQTRKRRNNPERRDGDLFVPDLFSGYIVCPASESSAIL